MAHQRAAIYLSGNADTIFTLSNSKVHHCHNGIVLIGDFKGTIENNSIEECENIGIKLGMCNKSKVSSNSIIKNRVGI
jgi:parallel beta-helix repeat protein